MRMRQLRLVGLAEDGDSLVLESPTGESYRLPVDERVRAACRGDLTRLGQIEIEMDNPLRPREIQTRVRSGESAEDVAASSGMPLDRVLRFAYPVLQERYRVVAQARLLPARPKAPQPLGELVEERLVSRGTDAATLRWDAWRREDGRWAVRLAWRHGDRGHAAHWSLDLGRRALLPEDPAAEQLSAEEFHARTITAVTPLAVAARAAEGAPTQQASRRAPAEQAPRRAPAEQAPPPARDPDPRPAAPRGGSTRAARDRAEAAAARDRAEAAHRPAEPARAPERRPREAEAAGGSGADDDGEPAAEARIAAGGGTVPLVDVPDGEDDRARRATVPSWDDILLGVRRRH